MSSRLTDGPLTRTAPQGVQFRQYEASSTRGFYGTMYRLQEIVDRILSSKTTKALLDEMRKALRLVGVDYFCLVRYGQAGEHVDQWVIGQRASQKWLDSYLSFPKIISGRIGGAVQPGTARWNGASFCNAKCVRA